MHSVQTRLWDPQPPSKHVSSFHAPRPSNSRHAHVTSATPAKRITFYKSGDNQFGGVRMAIHKRSFKCFDTLLDDLSQKVPLPFGVRTVTTPRATHTIKQLEQLQDGGCYLCSDRRHAKPINLELAGKRQGIWYNHGRRPQRPEAPSATPPGHMHLPYRQRRILLVKNSEPGMRRSIVLGRRSSRSLRAFLDEVSEVMQFHVRKLYTAEGRRIDSIQSLITCPGVLVCVGREAFSPLLINYIRKSSEEKLPGLSSKSPGLGPRTPGNGARSPATQVVRSPPHGAQSRASEYDEGHESKKNVNFGLETKKSIIHPRSDSSNRSARLSLSSEKSFGVFSQSRPAIMNDDIEKRVLVNKDGSLSVEMRVRFRLQSDETLQWSTEIKKSPSLNSESCPLSQTQQNYLQHGQSESCSDPDSTGYECVDYNGRPMQSTMEDNQCPCCYQRQDHQFDLWENPAHSLKHPPVPPPHTSNHAMMRHMHSSSSSSSCNSRRVVRCRARLSDSPGGSGSEQSQLVQEEMCVTEQVERRVEVVEDGDTQVEVCKVSRCCSRTELVAMDTNLRPHSGRSVEGELMLGEDDNRPFSAVSSSSHVLQSLKEDQDDEDEDLPPSASQCSHRDEPSPTHVAHLDEKPTSRASANSIHSTKLKEREGTGSRALSKASSCRCGAATPHSPDRVPSSASNISKSRIPKSEQEDAADDDEEKKRAVSGLSGHTGLSVLSQKSGASSVCPRCGGCKGAASSSSRASKRSNNSNRASPLPASPLCNKENGDDDDGHDDKTSDISAESTQSNKSNLTNHGRLSANLESTGGDQEERGTSAASHTSNKSHKSGCNGLSGVTADQQEERSPSTLSAKSNLSAKSGKSHKSKCTSEVLVISPREEADGENAAERAASSLSDKSGASVKSHKSSCSKVASPLDKTAAEEDDSGKRAPSCLSVKSNTSAKSRKADSVLSDKSTKSNVSAKSGASRRSACSHCAKATSPVGKAEEGPTNDQIETEEGAGIEERAASAMSAKSNRSDKSSKSAKERSPSPRPEARGNGEERATSQMSGRLSVKSAKSSKCNENEKSASPSSKVAKDAEESERPESMMSAKSENQKTPASARSGISTSSAKSHHGNTELDGTVDRSPSATSGRSHISAKSQKSNHPPASPNQDDTDTPIIETNGEEVENENQERSESVTSAKSKSSARSGASRKSNSSRNPSSPNVVTIKTPEWADDEGNERAQSAASGNEAGENVPVSKSPGSCGQTLSLKRTPSPRSHSPKTPAASPISSKSPVQHLQPSSGTGETRGPSALSVHSITSAKSGKSKCRCGVASALEKGEKEKEEEDKEDGKSEGAASFLSSSSKRQRKNSGGTEKPLSRASSGSISLGLPEDQDAADSDSGKSTVSFHKNTEATQSAPKSPESSSVKNIKTTGSAMSQRSNGNSSKSTSHNPIPTIEMPKGGEDGGEEGGESNTERTTSVVTVRSSKSHKSCCNCSVKSAAQIPESKERGASPSPSPSPSKTGSVKSASTTNTRKMDTVNNRASAMSGSTKVRSKSPASASVKDASEAKSDTENQDISRPTSEAKDKEDVAQNKADSVYSQSHCLRPESAVSTQSKSKKASQQSKGNQGSVKSECLSPVNSHKSSSVMSSSQKKETPVKSSSPCPLHSSRPGSKVEACSESTLSHSLSAADLLKETMAAARQNSQQSKASNNNDKARSEKSDRSKTSIDVKDREGEMELTPACLPNASPNEVVSDWLRSIPANTSLLALGNELNEELEEHSEKEMEDTHGEETTKEESPGEEKVDKDEKVGSEEEGGKEDQGKCEAAEEEKSAGPGSGDAAEIPLSKNWHCSAAVMKVLLSSSPGRCQSMPEVSPVYGRRLSTSARGLLDCLAQLQLIEPATSSSSQEQKDRKQQYDEIMNILQSLWLAEPRDIEVKKGKDGVLEQVTPPRSSSGVGMSSGSGGSGKDNGNHGGDEIPPKETELPLVEEVVAKVAEEDKGDAQPKDEENRTKPEETCKAEETMKNDEQNGIPQSPKATENPSSSDKSSTNNSSKSATDNERETLEGSTSGTPPNAPRAHLSKKLSQDPDPVWILNLLTKLEKQFMSHYIDAMAEFKVRWDLDDSIILDTMISELRDEVSRRIQSSIQREMRKIQGRAGKVGKSPRPPPLANISRESTVTDKRRRILKVMKNQSAKTADSLSDDETAGEFSDQRSEDEYCPCEACVRKKMAARPFKMNPLAAEAPVMMEFDLLKILQLKKSPSPAPVTVHQPPEVISELMVVDEEGRNLEVVNEEEEENETKENIKADIVLEETILEEDEEVEQEKDEDNEQGEEENSEEQEEGTTTGEEAEQDETSENGGDEGECTCQSAREEDEDDEAEETSSNTGEEGETGGNETGENEEETRTGDEDEESDKDTVKEASSGEVEEESGEDGAAENVANEESTAVEEIVEGNVSASADDEDDGTGEGESHEDEKGEESEEQEGEASEEEKVSCQCQKVTPTVCVTEGEEADAEDSDDSKHQSDTGAEESGREETGGTGDDEEKESGEDGAEEAADEDTVEELKSEEDGKTNKNKKEGALLHQLTKTSLESQSGSMEEVGMDPPSNPMDSIEVPKVADGVSTGGGVGHRRSRSPARVKRRKPKESDLKLDDF